jgi:hypothetical protein
MRKGRRKRAVPDIAVERIYPFQYPVRRGSINRIANKTRTRIIEPESQRSFPMFTHTKGIPAFI